MADKVESSELVRCDGCGGLFPKEDLRRCKSCGSVLCPSCRKHHVCNKSAETSIPYYPNVHQSQEKAQSSARSASADPRNTYRYSDSGLWIFPPAEMYMDSPGEQRSHVNPAATVTANLNRPRNIAKSKTSFDIGVNNFAEIFEISDPSALLDTDINLEHETALYLLQDDSVIFALEPGAHASSQIVDTKLRNHEFDPDKYTEVCLTRIIPIKIPFSVQIPQDSAKPGMVLRINGTVSLSISNPVTLKREFLSEHSYVHIDTIQRVAVLDIEKTTNEIGQEFTIDKLTPGDFSMPDLSSRLIQKCSTTLSRKVNPRGEVHGLKVALSDLEIILTPEVMELIATKKTAEESQKPAEKPIESVDDPLFDQLLEGTLNER